MNQTYLISQNYGEERHAGSKAKNDIENILKQKDVKLFNIKINNTNNKLVKALTGIKNILNCLTKINRNSTVIVQHPLDMPYIVQKYMYKLLQNYKNINVLVIIHDVISILFDNGVDVREMKLLKLANCLICHNEEMKEYLVELGVKSDKIIILGIFDYLSPHFNEKENLEMKHEVIIAGNLAPSKSAYVYQLNGYTKNVKFNLYGPNYQQNKNSENIKYFGQYAPEDLPNKLQGSFGLVWDGNSLESCEGNTGRYLMYNNPHKASLYISCGIPVIIWRKSALAPFIQENGLGITIDSIKDIENILDNISESQYQDMVKKTQLISKRLRNGYFTITALKSSGLYS